MLDPPEGYELAFVASVDLKPVVGAYPGLAFFPELLGEIATGAVVDYISHYGSDEGLQEWLLTDEMIIGIAGTMFAYLNDNPDQGKDDHGA